MTWLDPDEDLIDDIASRMDLRPPSKAALTEIIRRIHTDDFREVVCDLATGVGKTYLAAALVDYLAAQGVRNILVVTPGKTIQDKTVENFTPGSPRFVPGAETSPLLITAENFSRGQVGDALHDDDILKLFVFNVQQLIRPAAKMSRRTRRWDEFIGRDLYSHLQAAADLVVIADEHHVYRTQAKAFSSAIRDLKPRALIGLTATPDDADEHKVIYRYSLAEAIADGLVKVPVIVFRRDGHDDERTQLADACHLRRLKADSYRKWSEHSGAEAINPVLFVVCQSIDEAKYASSILAEDGYIGDPNAVLEITSQSSDKALAALESVEAPDSPIRAVVSVNKLTEGWDVKNIGVIVALRKLASETLTEQILGRGLRLPYGRRVKVPMIDQVDIVAHDSYRKLLAQKDVLAHRLTPGGTSTAAGRPSGRFGDATQGQTKPRDIDVDTRGTHPFDPARAADGENVDGSAGSLLRDFDAAVDRARRDPAEGRRIERTNDAPTITFPRVERVIQPVQFSLAMIDDADVRKAGATFRRDVKVLLVREAIDAERIPGGGVRVKRERQSSEEAQQVPWSLERVVRDLESRVLNLELVPATLLEFTEAARIARSFLEGAGATEDDEIYWGEPQARQAVQEIDALIQAKYKACQPQPRYTITGILLPIESRPWPTNVLRRGEPFERFRWIEGWEKSILELASFDSSTTEWPLADIILDDKTSPITWWLRIERDDPVHIELDSGGKYRPDFIAIDDEGVHWLIEGKADRDVEQRDVETKRRAAKEWVSLVNADGRFGTWRYLFCSETDIKDSIGAWENLLYMTETYS